MKIMYLITVLDGFGASMPIVEIVSVMRGAGHDVEVVALMPKDSATCDRLDQAGIPYCFLGDRPHQHFGPWLRLARLLRRKKPDVLWTSLIQATVYGQLAGRLCGVPVVSWQHNAYLKPSNRNFLRATKGLTARWIADSVATASFAASAIGLDEQDIDIWPLFFAKPDQPRCRPWDGKETFRFGSLGRLHANKRYDVLIEAVALIALHSPDAAERMSFEIAGTGKEHGALAALATERGLRNLQFVGYRKDPMQFLAGLHGYVQPSRNEGLCIAAHEAMHAGLPVIATAVGELANSIVSGRNGLHCAVDDPIDLANALMRLLADRERTNRMGELAHVFVSEQFSREKFVDSGRDALARMFADIERTTAMPGRRASPRHGRPVRSPLRLSE